MSETLIKAKNLKFRYPGTDKLALDDISFEIHKGEAVSYTHLTLPTTSRV